MSSFNNKTTDLHTSCTYYGKINFQWRTQYVAEFPPNYYSVVKAGDILELINPMASCQTELSVFMNSIDAKLKADEKARWEFKMKQYADKIAAHKEQVRIAEEKGKRDDTYRENQSKRDAVSQEKQSARNLELDKLRVRSYREIAVEQARNQPKSVTYNNIIWR